MELFVENVRNDIANDPSLADNYCVVVNVFSGYAYSPTSAAVRYIYKNIDEFEKKFPEDLKKIETGLGIAFQAWKFD